MTRNHRYSKDKADKDTLYELEEDLAQAEKDLFEISSRIEM